MKIGERKYGGATLQVRFCEGVPAHMKQDVREITDLYVPPHLRKQGQATELLRRVCEEADRFKSVLVLRPGAFGEDSEMTDRQLHDWYQERFLFYKIQDEPVLLMARMYDIFKKKEAPPKSSIII